MLLRVGADLAIHAKDNAGRTAIHWACYVGLEELVQALIDRKSGVNEQDRFARTPVMLAAQNSNTALVMCLLRAGASCKGLSAEEMNHLFHHACSKGDETV